MADQYFDASKAKPIDATKVLWQIIMWIVLAVILGCVLKELGLLLVIIGVIISFFSGHKKCVTCGSKISSSDPELIKFVWLPNQCRPFGETRSGRICPKCSHAIEKDINKYAIAVDRGHSLKTWDADYHGELPAVVTDSEKDRISSNFENSKDNAKKQLRTAAVYLHPECNAVIGITFITDEFLGGGGTSGHFYKGYKASGIPCIIK